MVYWLQQDARIQNLLPHCQQGPLLQSLLGRRRMGNRCLRSLCIRQLLNSIICPRRRLTELGETGTAIILLSASFNAHFHLLPCPIGSCLRGWEHLLVHDNGRSVGSHVGVKAVQSTSTSWEKLCDSFQKEHLVLGFEIVELLSVNQMKGSR